MWAIRSIAFVLAVLMYPLMLHLSNLLLTHLIVCGTLGQEARPQMVSTGTRRGAPDVAERGRD